MGSSRRGEDRTKTPSPADKPRCDICRRQGFAESILSCERCITVQHTFCLPNPLVGLPDRRWLCPACSESSLRLYPSRRRKRPNSSASAGSGGVVEGGAGGGSSQPSSDVPLSTSTSTSTSQMKMNGEANTNTNTNGSTKAKGGKTTMKVAGAGEITAVALASSASGSRKRARKSMGNGALAKETAKDSKKEAAKAAAEQDAAASREHLEQSRRPSNNNPADSEREPLDPGSTVTLFCRRDFRRYLRWKRRELASQDDERRKEEQTRARKTFSSIVASST
eukprot:g12603.t1